MSGEQRDLTFRFLVEPTDVNCGGRTHGGVVMKWIDQVDCATAVGWSGRCTMMVAVIAKLAYIGTSSMHFAVNVRARDPMQAGGDRFCTHCVIVFVALDGGVEGKLTIVSAWWPREDNDRRLAEYALKVMVLSKDIEQAVASLRQE